MSKAHEFFKDKYRHNSAFGFSHPKHGFQGGYNHSCHSGFVMPKSYTHFYSNLFQNYKVQRDPKAYAEHAKAVEMWWDYILGPSSPWKAGRKDIEYLYDGKKPIAYKSDGDVDLYVAFNLALACRTENQDAILAWFKFMEAGFGRIEALYLSTFIWCNAEGKFRYVSNGAHGYPFRRGGDNGVSYEKLVTKSPTLSNKKFKDGENGMYCNAIWKPKKDIIQSYAAMTKRLSATPIYKGMFKSFDAPFKAEARNNMIQGPELFKVLKQWKKEKGGWGET